ncbi:MAG: hypothetical protein JOZ77_00435 [Candidatus Eremiobacteraeota bacterium]|nr:hypothetical protein [Candidatus Eremiobacteraeota bacterium]
MQRVIVSALAVGIALFVTFMGANSSRATAVAAMPTPTPVALQYEEISRFLIGAATPPPPGVFQDDRAAIVAAANAPAPNAGIFGNIAGVGQAMRAARSIQAGFLSRYTYYNNWVRTDDIVNQTAIIVKCNLHQYIQLDLAHHTYRISSSVPATQAMSGPMSHAQTPISGATEPGTMDLTIGATRENLGPKTIEEIPTHGDSSNLTMAMTNATGSCKNSNFSMNVIEYISSILVPRAYCPLPRTGGPISAQEYVTRGSGCVPRMHGSGVGALNNGDRLAMYRLMSMGAGATDGRSFKSLVEAGNVRWLDRPEAEALFSIPPGFTQQQ